MEGSVRPDLKNPRDRLAELMNERPPDRNTNPMLEVSSKIEDPDMSCLISDSEILSGIFWDRLHAR